MEKDIKKYKVIKDYPTINGMLYKDEVVKLDNGNFEKAKIRVKDSTGKIWFVDKSILTNIWYLYFINYKRSSTWKD